MSNSKMPPNDLTPDFLNTPEMRKLLAQQEKERADMVEFLKEPVPRFVLKGTSAGWGVWDRFRRYFVDGFFDDKQECENCVVDWNRED